MFFHNFQHMLSDLRWRLGYYDSSFFHCLDFARGISFSFLNNGSGVTHSPLRGSGQTCDKSYDRFLLCVILLKPITSHLFSFSSDFANHNDAFSFRVDNKFLKYVNKVSAIKWISTDAHNSRLSESCFSSLVNSLVSESS